MGFHDTNKPVDIVYIILISKLFYKRKDKVVPNAYEFQKGDALKCIHGNDRHKKTPASSEVDVE